MLHGPALGGPPGRRPAWPGPARAGARVCSDTKETGGPRPPGPEPPCQMTAFCGPQPAAAWEVAPRAACCPVSGQKEVVAMCTCFEMQKFYSVE